MDFISNQKQQVEEMLRILGIGSIEDLLQVIPPHLRLEKPVDDDGLSEYEGLRLVEEIGKKNRILDFKHYLGAGAYEHVVPALVQAVCQKSEFLTSYTPYQAEASQGVLQAIFEFQTAICALTGMEVANASVYDGASACAEGVLMALRLQPERSVICMAESVHPHYQKVVETYLRGKEIQIVKIPCNEQKTLDEEALKKGLHAQPAAVLLQSPNFFGCIENLAAFSSKIRAAGALSILCANPLAYGVFASAGELGADIAVGDCQPFGIPLQLGGPYAGYMACRQPFVRQLPGRIVGETKDQQGRRGFVLTLQAREQHIRREKATSNLCTNQSLAAMASLVAMLWYGREGIPRLALTNFQRAAYLKGLLATLPGCRLLTPGTTFNEFVIQFPKPLEEVLPLFHEAHIEPGIPLETFYPSMKRALLICVTETKTQQDLEAYAAIARGCLA